MIHRKGTTRERKDKAVTPPNDTAVVIHRQCIEQSTATVGNNQIATQPHLRKHRPETLIHNAH